MSRFWTLTALVGAASLLPLELVYLRGLSAPLVCAVASLLLLVGLICGGVLAAQEAVVEHLRLGQGAASLVRASGALLPLALVGRTLFDGGFASTLALAPSAPYWVPMGGFLGLAAVLWASEPMLKTPLRRRCTAVFLLLLLGAVELGDRTLFVSEYPDVHAFLVLTCVVLATLALHLLLGPARVAPRPLGVLAGIMVLSTGCALGLQYGMQDQQVRWAMATSRTHARHVARVLRAVKARATAAAAEPVEPEEGAASAALAMPVTGGPCAGPCAEPPPAGWSERWLEGEEVQALLGRTRAAHLLMISVDALRADVLAGEQAEADFPHLTGLLRSGRHFRHAFAPSAGTDVSLASLLTGSINPFVPIEHTLPEALAAAGRRTHAVLPTEVLRWAGQTLLTRGLHSLDRVITDPGAQDVGRNTTSPATTDLGLAFVDQYAGELQDRPFFLWLHYFDVHEHDQIEPDDPALTEVLGGRPRSRAQKYRALVKIVDRQVGRLVEGLRQRGLWDRTMVVLLSDHGESLGEDPRFPENHGHFVYNALVHVPLGLRVPGVEPAAIDEPVSLIDLMPTLLGLCGARTQPGDGLTLLPQLLSAAPEEPRRRPIVFNESEQYALLLWPHKLLVRPADHLVELYNLDADFQERHDLSGSQGRVVRELKRLYRRFPRVAMDRSARGRQLREMAAQPPGSR